MQDFTINGSGTLNGGEFGRISVHGSGKCSGDITAVDITIDGSFKTDGSIKSDSIDIDGSLKCEGSLNVGKFDCDGMAKIAGNLTAKTIDVDGMTSIKGGLIEADSIHCDGFVDAEDGHISADVIDADGCIRAKEVVGDSITIKSRGGKLARVFLKNSIIDLIEATTIDIRGVAAQTVSGKDVRIGSGCDVRKVDCCGTLAIHPKAKVEEITGDYKMESES
ncbi:MAG: polymer-forming cytoskeletal protein [Christensenella sp.]|nr:polymer-forming cytoskeletal protein [Christensenella sp.]